MTPINDILAERGKTHGDFGDNAEISEGIMALLARGPSFDQMTPVQRQALRMIAVKMSRICSGDPDEKDVWVDIAGYATLVADRIQPEHPELPLQSAPEIEEGLTYTNAKGVKFNPDWHHGDKTVSGPGEGYRFLLKGEHPPDDTELWVGDRWSSRRDGNKGTPLCVASTYRTKALLPNV